MITIATIQARVASHFGFTVAELRMKVGQWLGRRSGPAVEHVVDKEI